MYKKTALRASILCNHCLTVYKFTNVNLDDKLRTRIKSYACLKCQQEKNVTTIWNSATVIKKNESYYEVYKILNHTEEDKENSRKYLVAWAGYPEQENSWEPEAHLDNAIRLVKEYCLANKITASLKYRVGSSGSETNLDKWVEFDKATDFVERYSNAKKGYSKNKSFVHEPDAINDTNICIFSFNEHAFVMRKIKGVYFIADGANIALKDNTIINYLKFFIKGNIEPIEYRGQFHQDECAISAVIIALEFLKTTNIESLPETIIVAPHIRKELLAKWKIENPQLIDKKKDYREYRLRVACHHCNKVFHGKNLLKRVKAHGLLCAPQPQP